MTSPCISYLILTGLTGIHGITTVSKLSVKSGGSVSVPCLYDSKYIDHIKYLCKGYLWNFCSYAVLTNQTDTSGRFSISDDTNQRIFTVTISDLTENDKSFWCAVMINKKRDVRKYFQLSVTTGEAEMSVEQQSIAALEGGSVTVLCRYKYTNVQWCRLDGACVANQTGSIDGATVTLNASVPNVFSVTMSGLRTENSGWYWCTNSDLQMPVLITVHEAASAIPTTMSLNTANFTGTHSTTTQNPSLLMSAETHSALLTSTDGESLQVEFQSSIKLKILISSVVLQLLIVSAAIIVWRIRHNRTKLEGTSITVNSQTRSDADVLYATVVHNQHGARQNKNHIPDESAVYSTIVMTSKRATND